MPSKHYRNKNSPFNGLLFRKTWVTWRQKSKTILILMKQEMMGWQWYQLDHMCIAMMFITFYWVG